MKKNKTIEKMSELMQILMSRHTPGRPASNGIFIVNIPKFRNTPVQVACR